MEEGELRSKISPMTLHSMLLLGHKIPNFDSKISEMFHKAELLRTLKLRNECGSPIKHVSHILFEKLRFLRVLDLSSTEIKELPTSVCTLIHLRYLDVSSTRIKKLPESVIELHNLETLKLKDCSDLVELPKEMNCLINLQYLYLDGVHQLTSMPPRMGQLTNMQILSIFIVGREEGFRIEELKFMKKLRGSLCIKKMENVTEDQVKEAQLYDNFEIRKLEFQWSSLQSKDEMEFHLIKPPRRIKQLKITRYGAESFPDWLSSDKFWSLKVIHLSNCNCSHLPDLGELPSLESLYIHEMHSMKEINHEFCGTFEELRVLEIDGMPCLEKWTAINMPCLRELTIIDCPKLVTLPEFMKLESLEHLRITLCPEIQSFPGEWLPESLQSLTITECAKLEEQCQKKDSNERRKIAFIPEIWIDYQQPTGTPSEVCKRFHRLTEHLKRCVIYTSILFPGDYEFEEDTLIQLWTAVGFICADELCHMNKFRQCGYFRHFRRHFKELHQHSIFKKSSIVCENYKPSYRVDKDVYELVQSDCPIEFAAIMEEGELRSKISPVTLHSMLLLGDKIPNFDSKITEMFHKAELLRTLKLRNECGSPIKHVSHILFEKLRFLRVLDLSSTEIKELPTSVCTLIHLRYLDVSSTRIKKLPESVIELHNLETLKLKDCSDLVELPKEMNCLINLQYLYLDGVHQLTSMPPRMGRLTNMQILSIFIVGREEGFRIEELNCMKELRGSLCIKKMENVTKDQANEAQLGAIEKLDFQWSSLQSEDEMEFNLIEPPPSIKQLKITRYGAKSFPDWLSSAKFANLEVIRLSNCNCTHLPDLGKLPSLESLYIHEMHSVKEINHVFSGTFYSTSKKLKVLEIDGMPCLEEWTATNMANLRELTIIDCPNLVTLPDFMDLESLEHLRITLCPEIQSFPGEYLPKSLQSLTITECEKLEDQCLKEDSNERRKIAGIPEIWIDYQQISHSETREQPAAYTVDA
ncbi:hypothetical protein NE237_023750 [Protea cynaroides]|uniref:Uncharacterized protein n=1 Tax=Protea cynaroides TaxID=273540 RepID=A0A9Q0K5G8_9MAGN|nr:hypothetical protein NE237_023750 [Protea cynaroides]